MGASALVHETTSDLARSVLGHIKVCEGLGINNAFVAAISPVTVAGLIANIEALAASSTTIHETERRSLLHLAEAVKKVSASAAGADIMLTTANVVTAQAAGTLASLKSFFEAYIPAGQVPLNRGAW